MCSGPTRYYFFYGGTRHYYGTRTWGQCNGHCDQDVYIDEAEFTIYYADDNTAPPEMQAQAALDQLWPSVDVTMVSVTRSIPSSARTFRLLLPDGTSAASFSAAVKQCVENACGTGVFVPNRCQLAPSPFMLDCSPAHRTASVAIRQISTQAEADGAALTLPSMLCLALAAVAALLR